MSSNPKLFNKVSGLYGWFFKFQVGYYNKILDRIRHDFDISTFKSVIDVGCGTGAYCKVLSDHGLKVTGVDPSEGMLNQARNRLDNSDIELIQIIPGERLPFPDKSFDIAITSYVAHGLKPKERIKFYLELKRIAKEYVIVHDYNKNRAIHTTIIEYLEKGDYLNFINVAKDELEDIFGELKVIDVDTRASWYICK